MMTIDKLNNIVDSLGDKKLSKAELYEIVKNYEQAFRNLAWEALENGDKKNFEKWKSRSYGFGTCEFLIDKLKD